MTDTQPNLPHLHADIIHLLLQDYFSLVEVNVFRLVSRALGEKVQEVETSVVDNVLIIGQMASANVTTGDDLIAWKPTSEPQLWMPIIPSSLFFASVVTRTDFGYFLFIAGNTGSIFQYNCDQLWKYSDTIKTKPQPFKKPVLSTKSRSTTLTLSRDQRAELNPVLEDALPGISSADRELTSALAAFHRKPWLVVGRASSVTIWNYLTKQVVEILPKLHSHALYTASVSADDKTLLTGSFDKKIWLWTVNEDSPYGKIFALRKEISTSDCIRQGEFSPDGSKFVVASNSPSSNIVYDTATGKEIFTIPGPTTVLNEAIFGSTGRFVYSACCDGKLRITDVYTRQTVRELNTARSPTRLALAANDQLLIATTSNHNILIFATRTGKLLRVCEAVTFSEYFLPVLTRPPKK